MLEQYVAIADYKKQNRNEVIMVAGDIVEVIDKNENGKFCILHFLPAQFLRYVTYCRFYFGFGESGNFCFVTIQMKPLQ